MFIILAYVSNSSLMVSAFGDVNGKPFDTEDDAARYVRRLERKNLNPRLHHVVLPLHAAVGVFTAVPAL